MIDEVNYITTPYKKKRKKKRTKKSDHQHQWGDCVYGLSFAGNFELSIGTFCTICGKIGTPTNFSKWKKNISANPKFIRHEWNKEAEAELNPSTRSLPYFNIDLFVTKFVDLEEKTNADSKRVDIDTRA